MRILIFNWRDLKNPRSGGAERVTQKTAKFWQTQGHSVTLFTSLFSGSKKEETIDGLKIIRAGNRYTVYLWAIYKYLTTFKGEFDLVIDEVNTIPFFTPLYVRGKKIAYVNQLAREVWFYEFPLPFSTLGYLLEPLYLRLYRNIPCMVISDSTKKDLLNLGIKKVSVFPMAADFKEEQKYLGSKEKDFTLLYVGRLVRSKRVLDVIEAFSLIAKSIPKSKLWIAGSGDQRYLKSLKDLSLNLGVENRVKFLGQVSQEKKYRLMNGAHLILVTSMREGWGLIVTEANALKTPAVVYDVPGLRDAVKHQVTGIICSQNSPTILSEEIINLHSNPPNYQRLQESAYNWSKKLTWENTGGQSLKILKEVVNE